MRLSSLGLIVALVGAAVPALAADPSAQIEARIGAWGRNCKNAIAERVSNASMADIRVSLSATTRSSIDAGEMTLKDIKQYGLIYNWERPFPGGSALKGTCYVDGKGNVTKVDSSAAQAAGQSKVKLNGHGQSTVTLYARPDFGAPISGTGVSGEVVNKLGCKDSGDLTWCRVGYPGQTGRNLWVPAGSLTFLGDGE